MTGQVEDSMREYSPVWISSIDHMKLISDTWGKAPLRDKGRAMRELPEGFPYFEMPERRWLTYISFFLLVILIIISYFTNSLFFFVYLTISIIYAISTYRWRKPRAQKIPIAYFSSGKLQITDNEISYIAGIGKKWGRAYNLLTDIQFRIVLSEISSIERFAPHESLEGFGDLLSQEWIRILTRDDILGGDFLLVVGGSGFSIRKIRRQTEEIYVSISSH